MNGLDEAQMENYLAHYGVLGMKWGVRKAESRERIRRGNHNSKPNVLNKAESNPKGGSKKVRAKTKSAPKPKSVQTKSQSTPKSKNTQTAPKKDSEKSRRQVHLEAHYLKKGLSKSAASLRAERRIQTEKILAVSAGVALAAVAAYSTKKAIGKRFTGVLLEAGKDVTYINATGDDTNFNRRLFVSFEEKDTQKYRGLLANSLRNNWLATAGGPNSTTIYETTLRAKETIKAPSHFEATKLYAEFRKSNNLVQDYKTFNQNLINQSETGGKFYDFMKSKGYNAVLDANDQFISGYSTNKPLIIFNAESSTSKVGQKVVSNQLSDRLARTQKAQIAARSFAPTIGLGVAAIGANSYLTNRNQYKVVNDYFKEHPNSKLSYAEVYANLNRDRSGSYQVSKKHQRIARES